MTQLEAITKVGKEMGKYKYHSYMEGAMLPRAELSEAHVIKVLFGGSIKAIEEHLYRVEKATFNHLRGK